MTEYLFDTEPLVAYLTDLFSDSERIPTFTPGVKHSQGTAR
jgi:hypothetical protein